MQPEKKNQFKIALLSLTTDAKSGLGVFVSRRRRGEHGDPVRAGAGDAPRDPPCLRTAKSCSKSCASCL